MSDFNSSHNTAYTPLSPAERYAQALASGQFMPDEAQAEAVHELDRVWQELIQRYKASKRPFAVFVVRHLRAVCICGVGLDAVKPG